MFKANKILIADDHPLFREALHHSIIKQFGEIEVFISGSFSSLQKQVEGHSDLDLILLDLHMPGAVGFSALHYLGISYPVIPVAIVSANEQPQTISRAIKLGASGFIPKSSPIDNIVLGIDRILNGEVWVPPHSVAELPGSENESDSFLGRLEQLTPKQFRVLMMLVEGRTNDEMAKDNYVTIATIKAHLSEIFKKLEVSNRTQAAMVAASFLEIDDPTTHALS